MHDKQAVLSIAAFMNRQNEHVSAESALRPLAFEEIDAFVQSKYSGNPLKRLRGIEAAGMTRGFMDPQCRVAVNIPALFSERALGNTLDLYARQSALGNGTPFEIDVLINGPDGVDLENSDAMWDALAAQESSPVPINIYSANYMKGECQIGRIRRDLAVIAIRRALTSGHADPGELVLVTNDADGRDATPEYIDTIATTFANNPGLGGATGFIDLPREDFQNDHLLLAAHRTSQMFEMIYRAKHPHHPSTMRGGNSAFRVRDYVRGGGHPNARISEHRYLYLSIVKTPGLSVEILPRRLATIVTDARRQLTTMATGEPVSASYRNFGKPGDVAEIYHAGPNTIIPAESPRADSPEFVAALTRELRAMVCKFFRLHETAPTETVQTWFRRAAHFAGITLDFDAENLPVVRNADVLRANILSRYPAPDIRSSEMQPLDAPARFGEPMRV